jgi:hypothetical protein
VILRINGQVRAMPIIVDGKTVAQDVYGVDFGAVLSYAAAIGAPISFVAEVLPEIEAILVRSRRAEAEA